MSETGAEFLAYVKRKYKRTDKDTEIYEATTDVIADMRIQFESEDFKEESYVTGISTLGEYRIGLPSDFGHIIGNITVTDVDNDSTLAICRKISKAKYDELYKDRLLSSTGNMNKSNPVHFCVYADQIYLGPVPDKTTYKYQFNYTTEAFTEVEASTDPVPFSGKTRNTLRAGVLAELHDGMENYEESAYWKAIYLNGLEKLILNDERNTDDSEPVTYSGI